LDAIAGAISLWRPFFVSPWPIFRDLPLQEADIAMIVECAKKMKQNPAYRHVAVEDLVYAGYVGFARARARYNPELGPFGAYARKCVRLQMRRKPLPGARRLRPIDPDTVNVLLAASTHGGDAAACPAIAAERGQSIRQAMSALSGIEAVVVLARFGLSGRPKTRPELARELGITIGHVRWLQEKAIRKLRKSAALKQFAEGA
jgi:RNA polymerase sigma factor (sigma-70 family)